MTRALTALPTPPSQRPVGHLGRWGTDPLALLDEGATLGPVFALKLWRPTVVGYSPEWNQLVLRDLDTFVSRGSLSRLTPYLAGGVVRADGPAHRSQRAALNPTFRPDAVVALEARLAETVDRHLPTGDFDAVEWSAAMVRTLLSVAFFDGHFPAPLLARFLRPLDRRLPAPFLRRPLLFHRMNQALAAALAAAPQGSLGATLRGVDAAVEQARVAISAGYDTTAHTMAWMLWHLAAGGSSPDADGQRRFVEETLRLYPAGWVGSRVCARDVDIDGHRIDAGTLVLYSPYLSHRDPARWTAPLDFAPDRATPTPWTYLPFAGGARRCLGMHLAKLLLATTLRAFVGSGRRLTAVAGDPRPRAGVTLTPVGPLRCRRAT